MKLNDKWSRLLPGRRFAVWFAAALLSLLCFDTLWGLETSWNLFTYISLYVNAVAASALLALPSALFSRRWPQVALMLAADAVMVANLMYCRTYFLPIPPGSYLMASNLDGFTGSVVSSMRLSDMLLPLITLAAWWIDRRVSPVAPRAAQRRVAVGFTLLAVVGAVGLLMVLGGPRKRIGFMTDSVAEATAVAPVYTLAGAFAYDLYTATSAVTPAEARSALGVAAAVPRCSGEHAAQAAPRRVLLILCESLESWPIGLSVDGREVTPCLNTLVADSATLFLPNVVTQVGNGRSIDSWLLMLAGLHPPKAGVWSTKHYSNTLPSLVGRLRERLPGLKASVLSLDKPSTWNHEVVARTLGFDTVVSLDCWPLDRPGALNCNGRPLDAVLFDGAVARLRSGRLWGCDTVPEFTMMVTTTGHSPFVLSDSLQPGRFAAPGRPRVLSDYLRVTAYTDSCIGVLIGHLRSRPDFASTMIIIAGDHEGLAADRSCAAGALAAVDRGKHTPFIVVNAPRGRRGTLATPLGQSNLFATMLDLMGLADTTRWGGIAPSVWAVPDPLAGAAQAARASDIILRGNLLPPGM